MMEEQIQYYKNWLLKQYVNLFEMSLGHKPCIKTIRGKSTFVKKANLTQARGIWKGLSFYCQIPYQAKMSIQELESALAFVQDRYKEILNEETT